MKYPLFVEQNHTSNYKIYRPNYPPSLYHHIVQFYFNNSHNQKIPVCLDVACGNGQATCDLADHYCDKVIGVDGSKNQIENAQQRNNIEYHCHNAEDLTFLPENSVNLVTVATALHWFHLEAFFKQVDRVLKKDGVLAIWTYGVNHFKNEAASKVIQDFDSTELKSFWSEKRALVDSFYSTELHLFPYPETRVHHVVNIEKVMTIRDYVKFIETVCSSFHLFLLHNFNCFQKWSAVQTFKEKNGDEACKKILEQLADNLAKVTATANEENEDPYNTRLKVIWPVHLYLMRK